ncbi:MAG TPA: UDP-3-O-(3-hydroxymyristoyl)glucosamine N-acyltransferase [Rhizomicrobium sp.]|jgi:UDP-3-O-[3-hydroxymyristoyl] glucosamine N-acyltransferase
MADPRFYDNSGPVVVGEICVLVGADPPADGGDGGRICDLATLECAGPAHATFCAGKDQLPALARTAAGICFVPAGLAIAEPPLLTQLVPVPSVLHAVAALARHLYPGHDRIVWDQASAIHPEAQLGTGVRLGPGVAIGPGVEIGAGSRIGANSVIGRGVTIGRDCDIGSNVSVGFAHIGDRVSILPGAQIGQPGFGFAASPRGHTRIPQLGRVIIQDDVEVGACTTVDRGALGDTVIGEGTKIDNLVQIGHNTIIGRHCVIVAQTGISGSCELGNFVVLGGQVGISDHVRIGDGARIAARGAATPGDLAGGEDYGGVPARPIRQWRRELAAVALLARRRKHNRDG